ncbi:serine protein kinase RIO [Propionibacteriaceae bacterium Y1685]|uniref:serine protein kinase RIO n=1 Tax=Microlunatus sp. Y1700 TaxID=3418487 RepID=UPI003B77D715
MREPFPFEYVPTDELTEGQRWSTWHDVERLCRGPEPHPDWVVTDRAAVDTELGVIKSGKEADCFLLERAVPDDPRRHSLLVAKRYRTAEHRDFSRSEAYTDGRSVRRSRDMRAIKKKSSYGKQVVAGQWAVAEWNALCRLYPLGLPVPYPVQIDGTEILMEYVELDGAAAPRLANTRPDHDQLRQWWEQLVEAMELITELGLAHGDLSPYNILALPERLVIIDLPQMVDLYGNPAAMDFLHRDCVNVCTWFTRRGLDVDAEELFARLVAVAW